MQGQEIPVDPIPVDEKENSMSQREKDMSVYDMLRKMQKKEDRGLIGAPELVIKKKDFGPEWKRVEQEAKAHAQAGELDTAVEVLLKLEKKTRSAMEFDFSVDICALLMELCIDANDWDAINVNLVVVAKRRQQHRKVIAKVAKLCIAQLDNARNESKEEELRLIDTLRDVSEGKIFLEVERARLTKRLADIREKEGKIVEAADILQEVKVETYGTMEKHEKTAFILEQMRLCLAKKDHVRAYIISDKIDRKAIGEVSFQELKLKFYKLLIEYHTFKGETLNLCRDYLSILTTPCILATAAKWQDALSHACIFCVLSEYGKEQNTLLHSLEKFQAERLEHVKMKTCRTLLKKFSTQEITPWPLQEQEELRLHPIFSNKTVWGKNAAKWAESLHLRVLQHNVRVVARYYTRIRMTRLAELLNLEVARAEVIVCNMVCPTEEDSAPLYARIDRPKGVISFVPPEDANSILDDWSSNVNELLDVMQKTRHLIDREMMLHEAEKKKKKGKK